uniref:Sodefrin-like factor n=1 Tax=Notophthalmus viridescens TaxID=8316 RepID=A0A0E3KSN9_NOTVI|nr:sodefrin precursor-like factor [Notophthalmus viridescens]
MKALLASISILFAFISGGNAIVCEVCSDRASMDCSGELVTCDQTVESCQTAITDLTFEGLDPIYNVFKNCSDVGAKNILFRAAFKDATYQQRVEVCQTNGCNKGPLQFPPENTTLNGVKCPTCVVDGELSCEATEVLQCVGEMTNCLYIAATFRNTAAPPKQAAYRGCTCAEFAEQVPIGPADTVQDVVTLIVSKDV